MIFTTVVLFSCINEKVQLVSNYEQQLSENVKIDLKFKCKLFEKINDIYSADSVKYFQDVIVKVTKWSVESISNNLIKYDTLKNKENRKWDAIQNEIELNSKKMDVLIKDFSDSHCSNTSLLDKSDKIEIIQKKLLNEMDIDSIYYDANKLSNMSNEDNKSKDWLDTIFLAYNKYKNISNILLCTKYKCVYTIFNPLVNAKQEITKIYYISPKNKIIKTEN